MGKRIAALAAVAWLGAVAAADARQDAPGLTLARAAQTAEASLGSFCTAGMCVDREHPPHPAERLTVSGGKRVTARRWRVKLPQRLRRANALDVCARGRQWDAAFWGGLRRAG